MLETMRMLKIIFNSKPTSMLVPSAYAIYCTKCRKVTDVVGGWISWGKRQFGGHPV